MSTRLALRTFAVFLTGTFLASCGPTNQEVISSFKDGFDAKRKQFTELAAKLPAPGNVAESGCQAPLDPLPVYDVKAGTFNTEIVMAKQLLDPDVRLERTRDFDINLSDALLRGMMWTGPNNPMSESARDNTAVETLKPELENALAYRYLVVNQPVSYTAPQAVDEKSFIQGTADVEGFLFDLQSGQLLCSFRYMAKTADTVHYEYKKDSDNPLERAEAFAYSTLWSSAREDAARILTQVTKGTFVLERY